MTEQRAFGNSDLKVFPIGFGTWTFGKGQFGFTDENEAIYAVHRAIDLGVDLFDTAAVYGWGSSEELLGRALKGRRDKVVLCTKGGRLWDPKTGERGNDSSRAFLEKGLEESLRRLQTDYVDVFMIHWPDTSRPMSEPMGVYADWKRQGKIRYGGVSNFSIQQIDECLKTFPIICNQVGYHLFDRRIESDVLPFCKKRGVGIMTYGSLAHGLLTGTMTKDTKFGTDDGRSTGVLFGQPLFQGETYLKNLEIVERLKKIAAAKGMSMPQLAAAWVLSNPAVTVALTGIRKPSEIEENIGTVRFKLTKKDRDAIEAAFKGEKKATA